MALNLSTANKNQGLEVIPAGTLVTLMMKIRPGTIGVEGLCKRSSKGDSEGVDTEYTILDKEYEGRKIYAFQLLDGVTAGHAKAAEITRALLRAIFEAVNAIDPQDVSPETDARRDSATLAGLNGATFLATLEVEFGGPRPEGGRYRDKNVIGKVLRVGDKGYQKTRPATADADRALGAARDAGPPHRMVRLRSAPTAIARPHWAQ